jgi:hypothetical protein
MCNTRMRTANHGLLESLRNDTGHNLYDSTVLLYFTVHYDKRLALYQHVARIGGGGVIGDQPLSPQSRCCIHVQRCTVRPR